MGGVSPVSHRGQSVITRLVFRYDGAAGDVDATNKIMSRTTSLKLAIAVLGIFPLMARASEPTTQPAGVIAPDVVPIDDQNPSPGFDQGSAGGPTPVPNENRPHRSGDGGGGRGRLLQRLMQPLSQKDIADAMIYMKDKSPNRYQALNSLPETTLAEKERKKNLQELTARNYLNWMRQLNEDPELYSVILRSIEAEDDVFGLVSKLSTEKPEEKAANNARLREAVSKIVDLGIQERHLRLDRLQKTIKEQQQKLQEDSSHRETLVEERLKTILGEGLVPSSGGGGPHGRR
jgi:hypothetical protein